MKLRFTIGNILGVLLGIFGVLVDQGVLTGVDSSIAPTIIGSAGAILAASKGLFTKNNSKIPEDQKLIDVKGVTVEKTLGL